MTVLRDVTRRVAWPFLALVVGGLWASPTAGWAETWVLMGREGGCVSLAEAAQRRPEFENVSEPEDLAKQLRTEGHVVSLNEIGTDEARIVSVEAPDAGIAVVFAPERMCGDEADAGPR